MANGLRIRNRFSLRIFERPLNFSLIAPMQSIRSEENMAERKSKMISMRLTESQYEFLDSIVRRVRHDSGFKITRASIMLKLMELGFQKFEQEYLENPDWSKTA